ncbi:MAG: translocation/assembly module TamB domain-containing protein [Steroidobacteraceae bacterium]|nr:translocation/assembly module TamB domain-containing protein [Steroidobacteraceae bacterium]
MNATLRRRLVFAALALLATLLLAVAGAVAWLTLTQAGLDRAVAIAESLQSVRLHIEGARGRLAGPLAIDRFELVHERVEITVVDLRADYEPSSLAWGSISAESLTATQVSVHILPRQKPDDAPPRFLPPWLRLAVDGIAVDRAEVLLENGAKLVLRDVASNVRMSSTRLEARGLNVDAGNWSASGDASLVASEPMGLEGDLRFTAGSGREVRGRARVAGDFSSLKVDGALQAPLETAVDGRLLALDGAPRWEATFDVTRLDTAALAVAGITGPLAGRLEGSGTLTQYALKGQLDGPGLPSPGATISLGSRLETEAFVIDQVTIGLPALGTRARARATIGLASPLSYQADVDWTSLRWPLEGDAQLTSREGRLSISGTDSLRWTLDASAQPSGLPELSAQGEGRVDATELLVERVTMQGFGGRGTGSGSLGFTDEKPWRLSVDLQDIDPSRLRRDLSGRLSGSLTGQGKGVDQQGSWTVELRGLRGTFRRQPVTGQALVSHSPGTTSFERTSLSIGPARLKVAGRIGRETALDAQLEAADLSRLLPELGGSIRADIHARSGKSKYTGLKGIGLQASVTGTDLRWNDYRALRIGVEADIDLADQEPSWLRLRAIGVDLAGRQLAPTRLSLDGTSTDHALVLRSGIGEDAVELLGRGTLRWPAYSLKISSLSGQGPRLPDYRLEAPFELRLAPGAATLTPMCFVRGSSRACVEGNWSDSAPWVASLHGEDLPLAVVGLDRTNRPSYRGRLDLQAAVSGAPGRRWSGSGVAEVTGGTFSYRRSSGRDETLALGKARADLAITPDLYLVRAHSTATADTFFDAELTAPRDDTRAVSALPLSGSVNILTRELGMLPLFVSDIDRASGELRADLAISGPVSGPQVSGTLTLADGELDLYQTNLRLRAIQAKASFHDDTLTLESSARAGEGTVSITGSLSWEERLLKGDLRMLGERLLVANVPEARVIASPDIHFVFDASRATVTGTVLVPEARIAPAAITGAVLASSDERLVGAGTEPISDSTMGLEARLTLTLGNKVYVDAFGLKGRLTGSLTAQALGDAVPIGTGEFKIEDAEYAAYTKELDVTRGRLMFAGGPLSDPGVDLRAERELPGYKVGVNVRGRLRHPEITFVSDPPLPQSEIASLLLIGRRLDSVDSNDTTQISINTDQLASQGGALLAGQLGRYVGIDAVEFEKGPNDESSLVIGKFLSPRLYVSYGISLAEQINTLKMRYTIGDRWLIKLEAGDAQSLDIEFNIDR